jgi:hypothetical protein
MHLVYHASSSKRPVVMGKSGCSDAPHPDGKIASRAAKIKRHERFMSAVEAIAFSSEVETGPREENASKQEF